MSENITVCLPLYIPTDEHRRMTDKCIYLAKANTSIRPQWIITETVSNYYQEEADVYIWEREKVSPNRSFRRCFCQADGDYVIFLSNDVFVGEGWIESMLECFRRYPDCGLASLGNNEHGDTIRDEIIERVYFATAMTRREDMVYDPDYIDLFDDSDMIMRILVSGRKAYKNLNCYVEHLRHKTYGPHDLRSEKSLLQLETFKRKWSQHKEHPAYGLFVPV